MESAPVNADHEITLTDREISARDAYLNYGYAVVDHHNELHPGARVRLTSEQYPEALNGTGMVVVVMRKDDSAWSQKYGTPDVELVVRRDDPKRPIAEVAQYHVVCVPQVHV